MIISVIVSDGTPDVISTEELDELLKRNAILAFRRKEGWVRVGFDAIRSQKDRSKSSWRGRETLCRRGADLK